MSKTMQRAGRLVAVYVDDGQGRRVVLADDSRDIGVLEHVLVVGTTRREVRATISTLEQLCEELPP